MSSWRTGPAGSASWPRRSGRPVATSSPCTWSASLPTTVRSPTNCSSRCRSRPTLPPSSTRWRAPRSPARSSCAPTPPSSPTPPPPRWPWPGWSRRIPAAHRARWPRCSERDWSTRPPNTTTGTRTSSAWELSSCGWAGPGRSQPPSSRGRPRCWSSPPSSRYAHRHARYPPTGSSCCATDRRCACDPPPTPMPRSWRRCTRAALRTRAGPGSSVPRVSSPPESSRRSSAWGPSTAEPCSR